MTSGADPARSGPSADDPGPDERRAVLLAALAVSQQRGYHGTTPTRVAEVAGVDPEAVTSSFPGRAEMLGAALELAYQQYCDETPTWQEMEPLPDLRDELDRRLRRGVAAGVRAADFWRLGMLLNLEPLLADSDCGRLFLEVRERTKEALRDFWVHVLPDHVAADPALVELAVRGHMSLADGCVLAAQATPHWELDRMMRFVATGVTALLDEELDEEPDEGDAEESPT